MFEIVFLFEPGRCSAFRKIFLQLRRVQRCGHHDEAQIRPVLFLQIQRAGQRDVAVKMPLVKFVEDENGNALQLRVVNHLPQQNALGDEADFGFAPR